MALDRLLDDLHRTRQRFQTISVTLSQQCLDLIATMLCMIFTTICGIEHIQRASSINHLNFFEALYYVIVMFFTVGYGDISPDIWPSWLFVIVMICVAFASIPMQDALDTCHVADPPSDIIDNTNDVKVKTYGFTGTAI